MEETTGTSTAADTTDSASPSAGANTFSSLKAMFKNTNASPKKCKHCGATFQPKPPKMNGTIKI